MNARRLALTILALGMTAVAATGDAAEAEAAHWPSTLSNCAEILTSETRRAQLAYMKFLTKGWQEKDIDAAQVDRIIEAAERGLIINPMDAGLVSSRQSGAKRSLQYLIDHNLLSLNSLLPELIKFRTDVLQTERNSTAIREQTRSIPGVFSLPDEQEAFWKKNPRMLFVSMRDGRTLAYSPKWTATPFAHDLTDPKFKVSLQPPTRDLRAGGPPYVLAFNSQGEQNWIGFQTDTLGIVRDQFGIFNTTQKTLHKLSLFQKAQPNVEWVMNAERENFALNYSSSVGFEKLQVLALDHLATFSRSFSFENKTFQKKNSQAFKQPNGDDVLFFQRETVKPPHRVYVYAWNLTQGTDPHLLASLNGHTSASTAFDSPNGSRLLVTAKSPEEDPNPHLNLNVLDSAGHVLAFKKVNGFRTYLGTYQDNSGRTYAILKRQIKNQDSSYSTLIALVDLQDPQLSHEEIFLPLDHFDRPPLVFQDSVGRRLIAFIARRKHSDFYDLKVRDLDAPTTDRPSVILPADRDLPPKDMMPFRYLRFGQEERLLIGASSEALQNWDHYLIYKLNFTPPQSEFTP